MNQATAANGRADIEAFNHALADATRGMDNAAMLALWTDDGVSLLPATKSIEGKPAIGAFVNAVTSSLHRGSSVWPSLQYHGCNIETRFRIGVAR
ncbi:hypothetical protein BH11GEM1_BH11GEM1_28260 [soil metagenome]